MNKIVINNFYIEIIVEEVKCITNLLGRSDKDLEN